MKCERSYPPWQTSLCWKALFAGFYVYRAAWTPVLGEELTAERESGNSEDSFAVRLKRGGETVGHVPHEISKIC